MEDFHLFHYRAMLKLIRCNPTIETNYGQSVHRGGLMNFSITFADLIENGSSK